EDLAAHLKDGARSRGRNRRVERSVGAGDQRPDLFEMRSHRKHVGADRDVYLMRLARFQIVEVQRPKLLVHNGVLTERCRLHVEAIIANQLLDFLGRSVVREQRDGSVTIREEVDLIAAPHWDEVVGIVARKLFEPGVTEMFAPEWPGHDAPMSVLRMHP